VYTSCCCLRSIAKGNAHNITPLAYVPLCAVGFPFAAAVVADKSDETRITFPDGLFNAAVGRQSVAVPPWANICSKLLSSRERRRYSWFSRADTVEVRIDFFFSLRSECKTTQVYSGGCALVTRYTGKLHIRTTRAGILIVGKCLKFFSIWTPVRLKRAHLLLKANSDVCVDGIALIIGRRYGCTRTKQTQFYHTETTLNVNYLFVVDGLDLNGISAFSQWELWWLNPDIFCPVLEVETCLFGWKKYSLLLEVSEERKKPLSFHTLIVW